MLETILKLYTTYMAFDVRSPMPHLIGPPGCGKSTTIEQAASLLGVNLHIINVARLSPLEVEGVQMPHGTGEEMVLRMLPATFWTQLKQGDILLMDEFLRGFPEVYNALLDIFTSRRAGAFRLPKVFIVGASNSNVAYDPALEDRLLHIAVEDPRTNKKARARLAQLLVEEIGLMPDMAKSVEMSTLLDTVVLPMFNVLDTFKKGGSAAPTLTQGKSVRNLIGQAKLRHIVTSELRELIDMNNRSAISKGKVQFVVLPDGKGANPAYERNIADIPDAKLTPLQLLNRDVNLQLVAAEMIRLTNNKEGDEADDHDLDDLFDA